MERIFPNYDSKLVKIIKLIDKNTCTVTTSLISGENEFFKRKLGKNYQREMILY